MGFWGIVMQVVKEKKQTWNNVILEDLHHFCSSDLFSLNDRKCLSI